MTSGATGLGIGSQPPQHSWMLTTAIGRRLSDELLRCAFTQCTRCGRPALG
jgi:hypothetical protein